MRRVSLTLNHGLANVAGICAGIMMMLIAADVIGRYFLTRPVPGAYEVSEHLMVPIVFLTLAYVQARDRHVKMELLTSRVSGHVKHAMEVFAHLLALLFYGMMAWNYFPFALLALSDGESTMGLIPIPVGPFKLVIAIGATLMALQFVINILSALSQFGRATEPRTAGAPVDRGV